MEKRSSLFSRCQLVVMFVFLTTARWTYGELRQPKNIGQAEELRLSPFRLSSSPSSRWAGRQQQPVRTVGVVEPGRLLNIFLGAVLVVGFAVLNSFLFMAIGISGNLPPRFVRDNPIRAARSTDNAILPELARRIYNAIDES